MTDFRALCVELTDCLEKADWPHRYRPVFEQWIYIARKALAEPEPEGPTTQELKTFACKWWNKFGFVKDKATCRWVLDEIDPDHFADFARAVLARWGNHPGSPDSSTQPIPVSERLPGPENFNSKGECWWLHPGDEDCGAFWTLFDGRYRVGYTHWLPANALPQPS